MDKEALKRLILLGDEGSKNDFIPTQKRNTKAPFKSSVKIINNLANTPELRKVKIIKRIFDILNKIFNEKLMSMIVFATYNPYHEKPKLIIKVMHPVAQEEFNHKKGLLLSIFKNYTDTSYFQKIDSVSIIREDRLNKFSKNFDEDFYRRFYKLDEIERQEKLKKIYFYEEVSYGIFENHFINKKLNKKVEEIRAIIKKNKKDFNE